MNTYEERLDKAAQILCEMRDQNPFEELRDPVYPGRIGGPTFNPRPRWHDARAELVAFRQCDEAFELAGQRP